MVFLRRSDAKVHQLPSQGRLMFGRQGDLEVNDALASRRHFVISTNYNQGVEIQDLNSTHGTFINDKKLEAGGVQQLLIGDIITVGSKSISYQLCTDESPGSDTQGQTHQRQIANDEDKGKKEVVFRPPPPPYKHYRSYHHNDYKHRSQKRGRDRSGERREIRHKREKKLEDGLMSTRLDGPKPIQQSCKQVISPPQLNIQQKKKLLWAKKEEQPSTRWQGAEFYSVEDESKFKRLMGVKTERNRIDAEKDQGKVLKRDEQEKVFEEVEGQFFAGLRRADGRTVGLGL